MPSQGSTFPKRRNITVIAGFICAPDRFPHAEWMSRSRVIAIARPVRARRRNEFGRRQLTGEPGYSRSVVKTHAETMKMPSSADSIRYSGQ